MSNSCDPMDCNPLGSSVYGILQARILEWVSISFSRGSSQPRNWTQVSCIEGGSFTVWTTSRDHYIFLALFGIYVLNNICIFLYISFFAFLVRLCNFLKLAFYAVICSFSSWMFFCRWSAFSARHIHGINSLHILSVFWMEKLGG